MRQIPFFFASFFVLVAISACRNGDRTTCNRDESFNFEDEEVIARVSFGCDDTPENMDIALRAAGLPLCIQWDCNGDSWITPVSDDSKEIDLLKVNDSVHYICEVAKVIFNNEHWLRVIYTEDVTGQYWLWMTPEKECGVFYKTDLFDTQAEPFQICGQGVKVRTLGGDCDAIVVRYTESTTYDTVPLIRVGD